jgi:hypothetical protein
LEEHFQEVKRPVYEVRWPILYCRQSL